MDLEFLTSGSGQCWVGNVYVYCIRVEIVFHVLKGGDRIMNWNRRMESV